VSPKRNVKQKDGSIESIWVALTRKEWEDGTGQTKRRRRRKAEPVQERTTRVPELVELWDEMRRDPFADLDVRRCPPGYVPTPDKPWSDHPYDFFTAAEVRRLRITGAPCRRDFRTTSGTSPAADAPSQTRLHS
jgi:hypothetical protein